MDEKSFRFRSMLKALYLSLRYILKKNNQKEKNLVRTLKTWQQEKGFHRFFYGRGQTYPEIHFEMISSDAQKCHCHKIPCSNLV